ALVQRIANQKDDMQQMIQRYKDWAPATFGETTGTSKLAEMMLIREFGRRPKRANNLESMGLVSTCYPTLANIQEPQLDIWTDAGLSLQDWHDFLKICLDFFVRAGGSLQIDPDVRGWLGIPFPQTSLLTYNAKEWGRKQRRWPQAQRGGMRSTLVRILAHVMQADITLSVDQDRVDMVLQKAWHVLKEKVLERNNNDWTLPTKHLAFLPMKSAFICPITRRFLDVTLDGITPYATQSTDLDRSYYSCEKIDIPFYDQAFGGDTTDEIARIARARQWLSEQSGVESLRKDGHWIGLNDRVIELAPYFTAAEHSAQQDSKRLERYEKQFKQGALNMLSCSTTMEMGIDIGGISLVAMNNVPPHPSNYLQRAGRAGRRNEARSTTMTLCKSNPHDQTVFANSRWAFDTVLQAPHVSLDSANIVQRHIHAYVLNRFLANVASESTTLTCGWFFTSLVGKSKSTPANKLITWCEGFDETKNKEIVDALQQLTHRSVLAGITLKQCLQLLADKLANIEEAWIQEWHSLCEQEESMCKISGSNDVACIALSRQKQRASEEYLLRELATRGFLPGYGFPTNIVSFDNMTASQMNAKRSQFTQGREDNRSRRREMASRDRALALREYAPGSQVVMDGLIYRSAGITLNWHIPANEQEVRETQAIRFAWRCAHCGGSGSESLLDQCKKCPECGKSIKKQQRFIVPAGFSTDFYVDPNNDLSQQSFIPVEPAYISSKGSWSPLDNPELGHFRYSEQGHMYIQSKGQHGLGYAICLACGRAEPMQKQGDIPPKLKEQHFRLRGSRKIDGICSGSSESWKIMPDLALGHEQETHVFELQLRDLNSEWLNDETVARTLAVALRDVLADFIGIQSTEIGCSNKPVRQHDGMKCQSIILYDRFAAGYVGQAGRNIAELLNRARKQLNCSAKCDSACPQCVLDFDQRFDAERLDRKKAMAYITPEWLNQLRLPSQWHFFGQAHSRVDIATSLQEALLAALRQHTAIQKVSLFTIVGDSSDLAISPLRMVAYDLAGRKCSVDIVLANPICDITREDRYILAAMAEHPQIQVCEVPNVQTVGSGFLLAEARYGDTAQAWAVDSRDALLANETWAVASPLITADTISPCVSPFIQHCAAELHPPVEDKGDKEISIQHDVDGELQQFGSRFLETIIAQHAASHDILKGSDVVTEVHYQDRYLFNPLAVALLLRVCHCLQSEGDPIPVTVVTTNDKNDYRGGYTRNIWHDWRDLTQRDEIIKQALSSMNMLGNIDNRTRQNAPHNRTLTLSFASGKSLRIRLDQGFSYWKARQNRQNVSFPFDASVSQQAQAVLNTNIMVKGGDQYPTQIFCAAILNHSG
ncbi:MAG: helicase-related protein, partial [Mariprofundaceae bacterium]|nr:helicase-related protein [Mariprofundaceae bacterium]